MARSSKTPLSVLVEDYRVACEAHLRPRTVACYMKALRELVVLLDDPPLGSFTVGTVAPIITRKRAVSASNARLIAAVAKAFSHWLYRSRLTPAHALETLGVPAFNGRRRAFTDIEFKTILRALQALPNRTRKRDRALVLLAMGSGLRSNEIRNLKIDDVHIGRPISESWALIRWDTTKSKQERKVRIAEDAAAAIHAYVASDRLEVDGSLFLTEEAKQYTYDGWGKYFGRIADALEGHGVKGFGAHKCRHQWATMGARTGMTHAEMCQEGGWERGSKVPSKYIDEIPFEEMQRRASPMTAFLRKAG
jgi:integrase